MQTFPISKSVCLLAYLAKNCWSKNLMLLPRRGVWFLLEGTLDGGEGECKFLPRPPGPTPILPGGPLAHLGGGAAPAGGGAKPVGGRAGVINTPHATPLRTAQSRLKIENKTD